MKHPMVLVAPKQDGQAILDRLDRRVRIRRP
jgi:hypothetical protein